MKKQIILVLSFLIMILCLTGCTNQKTISGEKVDEMTEIANGVVNQKGYVLPEGCTVAYTDNTTNARITITDNTNNPKVYYEIVFDVSKEEIEIVEISVESDLANIIISTIVFLAFVIVVSVYAVCLSIDLVKSIIYKIQIKRMKERAKKRKKN